MAVEDLDADAGSVLDDEELVRLSSPDVLRVLPTPTLELPPPQPSSLPLRHLEPEQFERLVAELVYRIRGHSVAFYGRRGQTQYGLDIVESEADGRHSVYQVRRYQELTRAKIRSAVTDYAGPPRGGAAKPKKRRFDAHRFVLVTSANVEDDTELTDEIDELRAAYQGDLAIEVWGAEKIGRLLRSAPYQVLAVFGPPWAQAWCGLIPPIDPAAPPPFGLAGDPIAALGLTSIRQEAEAQESSNPTLAADRYASLAQALDDAGMPGHASTMRRHQAKALNAGGDHHAAFAVLSGLAVTELMTSSGYEHSSTRRRLNEISSQLNETDRAKRDALDQLAEWYETGGDRPSLVTTLTTLQSAGDRDFASAACLALEQAIVDGFYDGPLRRTPIFGIAEISMVAAVERLVTVARTADTPDPVLRARIACAVADASLALDADANAVETVFASLLTQANTGQLLHARSLVLSRAAYAHAVRGNHDRAVELWQQAIINGSEDGLYGDVRAARRSIDQTIIDRGAYPGASLSEFVQALPNDSTLLPLPLDTELAAMDALVQDKVLPAYSDVRHVLWHARISGHLDKELLAWRLYADLLRKAHVPTGAAQLYVRAGTLQQAVDLAADAPEPIYVTDMLSSRFRLRRSAAIATIGAQADLVADADVDDVLDVLLSIAAPLWTNSDADAPWQAIKAITRFGLRIPARAVGRVLALARPVLDRPNTMYAQDVIALLLQTYASVEAQRDDLGDLLAQMIKLPAPPENLWAVLPRLGDQLTPAIRATLSERVDDNSLNALVVLAHLGDVPAVAQRAIRAAAAAYLRSMPADGGSGVWSANTADITAFLVAALCSETDLTEISAETLPVISPIGGRLFFVTTVSAPGETPAAIQASGTAGAQNGLPDEAAKIAAGDLGVLVAALVSRLLDDAANSEDLASNRIHGLTGLIKLSSHLPVAVATGVVTQLLDIAADPHYSEHDQHNLNSDVPLSRFRANTGERELPAVALYCAAALLSATAHKVSAAKQDEVDDLRRAVTAQSGIMLQAEDAQVRAHAAAAIELLGGADPALAIGLLAHSDPKVRATAIRLRTRLTANLLMQVAGDDSRVVRASVASRWDELPAQVHDALLADPSAAVRRAARREMTREDK